MSTPENNGNALAGLNSLMGFLQKPEVTSLWYHNQEIKLDGYKFVSCRFDNCKLILTSANFEMENCYIDPSTLITYGNDVARPIKLFNSRFEWAYHHFPDFVPIKNSNGTITIKG